MAIQYDLINNNTSSATKDGVQITTGVIVNELASMSGPVQLDTAINMVGWMVGSRHPIYPQYTCIDIDARSIGPNEVAISYTFEYKFPQVQYEIGSTVGVEQTNMDKDGNIVTATYTYPSDYKENPELAGNEFETAVMVDKYVPETTLTITRQEVILGLDLLAKSREYTGKINSAPWSAVNDSYSKQWICTGITGTSSDNGITYAVRYSFINRPWRYIADTNTLVYGWQKEVVFVDPRTDEPPTDEVPEVYDIYSEADFNNLGLV